MRKSLILNRGSALIGTGRPGRVSGGDRLPASEAPQHAVGTRWGGAELSSSCPPAGGRAESRMPSIMATIPMIYGLGWLKR
jgi:hypothetical protein